MMIVQSYGMGTVVSVPEETSTKAPLTSSANSQSSSTVSPIVSSTPAMASKSPATSKPAPLVRHSSRNYPISYYDNYEENQEKEIETKVLAKAPGLKKVLGGFEKLVNVLKMDTAVRGERLGEVHELIQSKVIEEFQKHKDDEERNVMANKLASIDMIDVLVRLNDFIRENFQIEAILNYEFVRELMEFEQSPPPIKHLKEAYLVSLDIREVFWNYSDNSHRFSLLLSRTNILQYVLEDLRQTHTCEFDEMRHEEDMEELFPFSAAVGILHNCAKNQDVAKDRFRSLGAIEVLKLFLEAESPYVKMVTLLALANMVSETEIQTLEADNDVTTFLAEAVEKAMKSPDHKEHGFHLAELIDGLAAMAQSNNNKGKIMDKDILTLVEKILTDKNTSSAETLACVKLVWELSFSDTIKTEIKSKDRLIGQLRTLKQSPNKEIREAALHAMFLVEDKERRLHEEKKPKIAPSISSNRGTALKPDVGHIMISYSWGDKETVLKIYGDLLQANLPIWIDRAEMAKYMNLLDGMARAVEDSSIILMCFSEKYKSSTNAKTEADYLYARKKKFIPLRMQRDYTPDGWLGALVGAKLFIDFSGKYPYTDKITELLERIYQEESGYLKADEVSNDQPSTDRPTDRQPPKRVSILPAVPELRPSVKDWTKERVQQWLNDNKLEGSRKLKQLTGRHLAFLLSVSKSAPGTYYEWLETKLDLKTLDDIMNFDEALKATES